MKSVSAVFLYICSLVSLFIGLGVITKFVDRQAEEYFHTLHFDKTINIIKQKLPPTPCHGPFKHTFAFLFNCGLHYNVRLSMMANNKHEAAATNGVALSRKAVYYEWVGNTPQWTDNHTTGTLKNNGAPSVNEMSHTITSPFIVSGGARVFPELIVSERMHHPVAPLPRSITKTYDSKEMRTNKANEVARTGSYRFIDELPESEYRCVGGKLDVQRHTHTADKENPRRVYYSPPGQRVPYIEIRRDSLWQLGRCIGDVRLYYSAIEVTQSQKIAMLGHKEDYFFPGQRPVIEGIDGPLGKLFRRAMFVDSRHHPVCKKVFNREEGTEQVFFKLMQRIFGRTLDDHATRRENIKKGLGNIRKSLIEQSETMTGAGARNVIFLNSFQNLYASYEESFSAERLSVCMMVRINHLSRSTMDSKDKRLIRDLNELKKITGLDYSKLENEKIGAGIQSFLQKLKTTKTHSKQTVLVHDSSNSGSGAVSFLENPEGVILRSVDESTNTVSRSIYDEIQARLKSKGIEPSTADEDSSTVSSPPQRRSVWHWLRTWLLKRPLNGLDKFEKYVYDTWKYPPLSTEDVQSIFKESILDDVTCPDLSVDMPVLTVDDCAFVLAEMDKNLGEEKMKNIQVASKQVELQRWYLETLLGSDEYPSKLTSASAGITARKGKDDDMEVLAQVSRFEQCIGCFLVFLLGPLFYLASYKKEKDSKKERKRDKIPADEQGVILNSSSDESDESDDVSSIIHRTSLDRTVRPSTGEEEEEEDEKMSLLEYDGRRSVESSSRMKAKFAELLSDFSTKKMPEYRGVMVVGVISMFCGYFFGFVEAAVVNWSIVASRSFLLCVLLVLFPLYTFAIIVQVRLVLKNDEIVGVPLR